ncbi:MAG: DNA mismatch repair endonuclease MutH [Myxococcota bacterium]
MVDEPDSEDALMERARALAGCSLGRLAARHGVEVPPDARRAKGWVGNLLEAALGATAGSHAMPDFPDLGVELKTLPVDHAGRPRESTWVCTASLEGDLAADWRGSKVREKLARVLWIPVLAEAHVPIGARAIGAPLLWSPSPEEERVLRADWEELTELLRLGRVGDIDARRGRWLQLRPKAANARESKWVLSEEAEWVRVNPKGFYLRSRFTARLLEAHFALPR